jgi:hypothetical protein
MSTGDSQLHLEGRYIPMPRRPINHSVEVPIKMSIILPSGARYTVCDSARGWGADTFGQVVRERDRKRGAYAQG